MVDRQLSFLAPDATAVRPVHLRLSESPQRMRVEGPSLSPMPTVVTQSPMHLLLAFLPSSSPFPALSPSPLESPHKQTPFLRVCFGEKTKVLVAQSCPTVCDPIDCCLSRFSVHGILQAGVLEWVAISFSRESSRSRD